MVRAPLLTRYVCTRMAPPRQGLLGPAVLHEELRLRCGRCLLAVVERDVLSVGTMHEREQMLFELADAFVAFPGGFGTMEEIIEMLTWKQLGIHGKPVVFANIGGYFDPLLSQFERAVREGYARPEDRILFTVADNTQTILTMLEGAPVLERKAGDWT